MTPTLAYTRAHSLAVAVLLAALIALAGCGFQLKGTTHNGSSEWEGLSLRLISVDPRSDLTREVARELGKAAGTVYKGWRRLGLIDGEPPRGLTIGKRGPREAPVRDEVAVYLRDYPWMNARQIADAMTADGQPVSVYSVRTHRRRLRLKESAGG